MEQSVGAEVTQEACGALFRPDTNATATAFLVDTRFWTLGVHGSRRAQPVPWPDVFSPSCAHKNPSCPPFCVSQVQRIVGMIPCRRNRSRVSAVPKQLSLPWLVQRRFADYTMLHRHTGEKLCPSDEPWKLLRVRRRRMAGVAPIWKSCASQRESIS